MPGTPRDDAVPGTKLLCRKPRRSNRVEEGCWPRCRFGGCTPARTSRSARVMNCRRTRLLLPRGNPGGPIDHNGDWSRAGWLQRVQRAEISGRRLKGAYSALSHSRQFVQIFFSPRRFVLNSSKESVSGIHTSLYAPELGGDFSFPRGEGGGPVEDDGDWSRAGAGRLERFQEQKFLTVGCGTVLVGRGIDRDPGLKQNFGYSAL